MHPVAELGDLAKRRMTRQADPSIVISVERLAFCLLRTPAVNVGHDVGIPALGRTLRGRNAHLGFLGGGPMEAKLHGLDK